MWRGYLRATLIALGGVLLIGYGYLLILFPTLSPYFMFHPHTVTYTFPLPIHWLTTQTHNRIAAFYLYNPKARFTILYSHGNRGSLLFCYRFAQQLKEHGFSVFAYDYPGYGESSGLPNERDFYAAIDAAFQQMTQVLRIPATHIILYGYSIGTGPTIDLGSRQRVAGIIIQGGYTSIYRVITDIPLIPFDKFDNIDKLRRIHTPILFIHGTKDTVIPFYHGQQLFAAANPPKYHLWIPNGSHSNLLLIAPKAYWQTIETFASRLAE